jgi:hypothetical protein
MTHATSEALNAVTARQVMDAVERATGFRPDPPCIEYLRHTRGALVGAIANDHVEGIRWAASHAFKRAQSLAGVSRPLELGQLALFAREHGHAALHAALRTDAPRPNPIDHWADANLPHRVTANNHSHAA